MLKTFSAQIASAVRSRRGRRNLRVLAKFFAVLAVMITVYSITFHMLMQWEGQEYSWITGFYWTLTVMSTLGFGDITFHTDLGRLFSIVVLLSGMIFMLVLLPFTFIELFYEPWMKAQAEARAPRQLPAEMRGQVLLTSHDPVTSTLIDRLEQYEYPYAILVPNVDDALNLHDLGLNVMVGDLDDPETWTAARVQEAALVASTASDVTNTNVAFTVRGLTKDLPIITSARDEASVDILKLAGSNYVLRLEEMIGQSFARRMLGGDAKSHVIGKFDQLLIAEATAHSTPLVGKTLREIQLRQNLGVTVVGVWERGRFEPARSDTKINDNTVLVLAGSKEAMFRYDEFFCIYNVSAEPVVILGGGGVGCATARALARRKVDYRIVEPQAERIRDPAKYVMGSAADLDVLEQAGIRKTTTVIVTPRDDDLNVYLTIYCRQLRPDVQILSRATYERNVATLHRAGADTVLSYASLGTGAVMNMLQRSTILMVAEGLNLFKVRVPLQLAGRTIAESSIREQTGCSVVGIRTERGVEAVPNPTETLPADTDIVLIGTTEAEECFLGLYRKGRATNG
ncbi:MAG: NAD-binding protein [Planctomycetes bacterium]|nr:NAD-binding protein [Planctomycetota bacterium]MBL7038212.1 NAD-binding protein [Pirellulaceae bacterium]